MMKIKSDAPVHTPPVKTEVTVVIALDITEKKMKSLDVSFLLREKELMIAR